MVMSLPTRERELKPATMDTPAARDRSLPTRERELKLRIIEVLGDLREVAPYTGA